MCFCICVKQCPSTAAAAAPQSRPVEALLRSSQHQRTPTFISLLGSAIFLHTLTLLALDSICRIKWLEWISQESVKITWSLCLVQLYIIDILNNSDMILVYKPEHYELCTLTSLTSKCKSCIHSFVCLYTFQFITKDRMLSNNTTMAKSRYLWGAHLQKKGQKY